MAAVRFAIVSMLLVLIGTSLLGCGGKGEEKKEEKGEKEPTEKSETQTALIQKKDQVEQKPSHTSFAQVKDNSAEATASSAEADVYSAESTASSTEAKDDSAEGVASSSDSASLAEAEEQAQHSDGEKSGALPSVSALKEVSRYLQKQQEKIRSRNSPTAQAMQGVAAYLETTAKAHTVHLKESNESAPLPQRPVLQQSHEEVTHAGKAVTSGSA